MFVTVAWPPTRPEQVTSAAAACGAAAMHVRPADKTKASADTSRVLMDDPPMESASGALTLTRMLGSTDRAGRMLSGNGSDARSDDFRCVTDGSWPRRTIFLDSM